MNEPKTEKFPGPSGQTPYTPQGGQNSGWDATQWIPPDQPTPPRGVTPYGGAPATVRGGGAPAWNEQPAQAAGSPTIMLGPRPEPAFAWLVVVAAPPGSQQVGQPLPVSMTAATTVGRVGGNSIVLQDAACSSSHAKIRYEANEGGEQSFVIYDLASSNGLFVGTKEDYKSETSRVYRRALADGDYLLIGETTLVFKKI